MQSSKLSQLIGELYRHAHQADGWMAFFAMLETEIPSRSTTLMFEEIETHSTDIVLSRHLSDDELQVYGEHYVHTDVWAEAMADRTHYSFIAMNYCQIDIFYHQNFMRTIPSH